MRTMVAIVVVMAMVLVACDTGGLLIITPKDAGDGGGGQAGHGGSGGGGGKGGASTTGTGGEAGKGGSGGVGGTRGTGGAGGTACVTPLDCGADTECVTWNCANGSCDSFPAPLGKLLMIQVNGDCQVNICDGMGNATILWDGSDVADDGKDCTTDACEAGNGPTHAPKAAEVSCSEAGNASGKVCDGAGSCVECVSNQDCGGSASNINPCVMSVCKTPTCSDGIKDGGESDTDCGIACFFVPNGKLCPNGKKCKSSADCTSQNCVAMMGGSVCQ